MSAKKKSKFSFPTAYTVILIVMLLVLGLTYVIPSGKYSKLLYDAEANVFVIESPTGQVSEKKATQKTLDELGVKTNLSKFTDGSISKPVAIPGTYEQLPKEKPTVFKALTTFLNAPIQGLYDSIDIIALTKSP